MAITPQAALKPTDISLLGGNFPPGLNTATPDSDIGVDETPDGYGYDLTKDGVIAKATIPTASSRTLKTVTLTESGDDIPYFLAYRRLWNITNRTEETASNILTYGAIDYDDIYVPQRLGKISFQETANAILAIQPFGQDSLFIATVAGGYVLGNISDTRGFWNKSDIIEEIECGGATGVIEMDGVVYCSSENGLYAYDRGAAVEITRKVRDDLTNFGNIALTADYETKYIKGGTSYIYEVPTQKLFRWSGSSFRYTSRQVHLREWEPFSVDRLLFTVNHTDTETGSFKWQVKTEDNPWSEETIAPVQYDEDQFTMFSLDMDGGETQAVRKFQLRLTDLSTNLQIKEIRMDSEDFQQDDFSA